ncbi:MAG: Flp family type IVb pilin [Planctomycetota bacterium]|nr:MAG: Flp family type IVb pilin [Planctomycetota bacterium]
MVTRVFGRLRASSLIRDEHGATATEYAVMLALIIVVVIATLTTYGQNLGAKYTDIDSTLFP